MPTHSRPRPTHEIVFNGGTEHRDVLNGYYATNVIDNQPLRVYHGYVNGYASRDSAGNWLFYVSSHNNNLYIIENKYVQARELTRTNLAFRSMPDPETLTEWSRVEYTELE